MQYINTEDLFLFLHKMNVKARVLLCALPQKDLINKDVVYRRLSMAGFHKEAFSIHAMEDVDYGLLLLNLPEPPSN